MNESFDSTTLKHSKNPRDVIRRCLDRLEVAYEEEDGVFVTYVRLETVEGILICSAEKEQILTVVFRFPNLVPAGMRPAVGEFLHRLNYPSTRMWWDMDYTDGEVRCRLTTDLPSGKLKEEDLKMIIHAVGLRSEALFPYLSAVTIKAMTPEFAVDQAMAAIEDAYRRASE